MNKRSNITHTKYSKYTSDQEAKSKAVAESLIMGLVEGDASEEDVDRIATNLSDLALLWTTPARDPMHLRTWKVRLEREWPELHGAIDRVVKEITSA